MYKQKIIAFYLPQFHPFPENDEWWGKGFTEWTNVGKAKPLFKGHNQPRVPTELGYYDLRLPIVRQQQADMARDAGVTAFCYWHYWFGDGKRLIPEVFQEVLDTGTPDFPFCLGWANHSWYAKNWNSDGSTSQKLLIEQEYPGINDCEMHFSFLLKAFQDKRYYKVNGCPLLYIFDPVAIPEEYIKYFRVKTKENGFPDLYLVGNISSSLISMNDILQKGFDAVSFQRFNSSGNQPKTKMGLHLSALCQKIKGLIMRRPPFMRDYRKAYHFFVTDAERDVRVIPSLVPQWDHTPRSGWNGYLLINSTPEYFKEHVREVFETIKEKPEELQIVFLKSWNEWGEGNYMEPDVKYGRGYINALRSVLEEYNK